MWLLYYPFFFSPEPIPRIIGGAAEELWRRASFRALISPSATCWTRPAILQLFSLSYHDYVFSGDDYCCAIISSLCLAAAVVDTMCVIIIYIYILVKGRGGRVE